MATYSNISIFLFASVVTWLVLPVLPLLLYGCMAGLNCSLLFHHVSEIDGPQKGRMLYDSQVYDWLS